MATKKKSSPRPRARARVKTDRAQAAGKRIRETWKATVKVLSSAEAGAERRIRQLLARQKVKPADLRTALITIRARAQDVEGKFFEVDLDGLAAVCLQHEMDHLEGKLFVDYLSDLKRERIRKKLDKDRKERAGKARETASARAY